MLVKIPYNEGEIDARIIVGETLPFLPRLALNEMEIHIGPATSPKEYDKLSNSMVGGVGIWENIELLFHQDSLKSSMILLSLFGSPVLQNDETWQHLMNANILEGLLQLSERRHFRIDKWWNARHAFVANGNTLFSISPMKTGVGCEDALRLRIAPDFELYFCDNRLSGWILHNPAQYLNYYYKPLDLTSSEACLAKAQVFLRKYLDIIWEIDDQENDSEIDWTEDPVILGRFEELLDSIKTCGLRCYQLDVIAKLAEEKLHWWQ